MFGLMLIPLCGVIGAAIDYTRAADQLSRLQAAVDATVLNLSQLPATSTDAEVQSAADNAVRPYLTSTAVKSSLSVTATRTGSKIAISARGTMPTRFVSILGINTVPISAASTAEWGNTRLRVALALDVTGSMAQSGKLGAMQTAATNFITQMQGAAKVDGDVYVSIVPFAKDVNVGSSNYSQSWIRWSGSNDTWDENNGTCSVAYTAVAGTPPKTTCESKSTCSNPAYTTQASCTGAGTCSNTGYSSQAGCTSNGSCSNASYTTQAACVPKCSNATYTTQSTCTAAGTCSKSGYTTQSTCTAAGTCSYSSYTTQSTCTSYGQCVYQGTTYSNYATSYKAQCQSYGGTWTTYSWTFATWTAYTWTINTWTAYSWTPYTWTQAVWTPAAHSTWTGCVTDRDQNYDTANTAPGAAAATQFPAELYGSCPAQLMALSYDWTSLKSKISSLTANGATNQQIGLAWAFQSLTASPFSIPAQDPAYIYNKAIVLLSDGLNTQNRFYGNGSTYSSQVDDRQKILCDAVKAAGITVYTVQVNTAGDPTSTVLQYCANTGNFSELTSASQIVTTFQKIGTELTQLRITH